MRLIFAFLRLLHLQELTSSEIYVTNSEKSTVSSAAETVQSYYFLETSKTVA